MEIGPHRERMAKRPQWKRYRADFLDKQQDPATGSSTGRVNLSDRRATILPV
jgi:hypothetical protein